MSKPSSGRAARIAWTRNWLAVWSPTLPSASSENTPLLRTSSNSRPVMSARWAASEASVMPLMG
jgi:hypothetical protein